MLTICLSAQLLQVYHTLVMFQSVLALQVQSIGDYVLHVMQVVRNAVGMAVLSNYSALGKYNIKTVTADQDAGGDAGGDA